MAASNSESTNASAWSPVRLAWTVLVVLVAAGVAYWYGVSSVQPPGEKEALEIYGLDKPTENHLVDGFVDSNKDLVADAPTDTADLLDPDTITFSYLATDQERYQGVWASFLEKVGESIGKQVEFRAYDSAEDQLRGVRNGELHVAGINSGAVPMSVNVCGFVPVCSMGSDDKLVKYTMQIITRTDSDIKIASELKGRRLALTNPTSNSGWKAPLTILLEEFNLQPVRDFDVVYSNGHGESIAGIENGDFEIAAVASDELALAINRGVLVQKDFKVIYESEPFCNNVIGYSHRLNPELAKSLAEALLSISWEGTQLSDEFASIGADQFVRVSYKDDLKLVRRVDDIMGRKHTPDALKPPPSQNVENPVVDTQEQVEEGDAAEGSEE